MLISQAKIKMLKKRSCSWAPVKSHLMASLYVSLFSLRELIKLEPHCSPAKLPENNRQVAGGAFPCCSLVPAPLPAPEAQLGHPSAHRHLSVPSPSVTARERHREGESHHF